jgi:hypothetical protein
VQSQAWGSPKIEWEKDIAIGQGFKAYGLALHRAGLLKRWPLPPVSGDAAAAKAMVDQLDGERPVKRGSRKKGVYQGAHARRVRVVLRRIYENGDYPSEEELSNSDLDDQFCKEYDNVEGKKQPPSKHGRPSVDTVLRVVGRR